MAVTVYEIPLKPKPQTLTTTIGNLAVTLTVKWLDADEGGWVMDIADATSGASIIAGLPLVTGVNLLDQYAYLGFGCTLHMANDGGSADNPTFTSLGVTSHLLWEFPA